MRIFKNSEAKKFFMDCYEKLEGAQQSQFAQLVREKAEEKVLRLDDVDDFYLDKLDIQVIFNKIIENN